MNLPKIPTILEVLRQGWRRRINRVKVRPVCGREIESLYSLLVAAFFTGNLTLLYLPALETDQSVMASDQLHEAVKSDDAL
ncbi:MAG: hypothetical protein INR62_01300 [Rhodospirillales bacterium]|nr:hypothetical protein [Acetobacter sp.]